MFGATNKNENEVLLECSEDVPFSPLRQSYTPLPINQLNGDDDDDDDDVLIIPECSSSTRNCSNDSANEMQIIDIKLNGQETSGANDDEQPSNENEDENMDVSISKEDVVLFTINTTSVGV